MRTTWVGMCLALGCGDPEPPRGDGLEPAPTSYGPTGGADDPASGCTPGEQVECACGGGRDGVQQCRADGMGYGTCECGHGDGDESTGDAACGDEVCDEEMGESCETCEEDCGTCAPCTLAPACEGRELPPAIEIHADFLDDTADYVPPPDLLERLTTRLEDGELGARLVAAALDEPKPEEADFVSSLRAILNDFPEARAAVARQFHAAGVDDLAAYTAGHPATTQEEVETFGGARFTAGADPQHGGMQGGACDNPRLRVRVAKLVVHEEDDDFLNDEVYCAITAEASAASEIKVTPLTPPLDEGDEMEYSLEGGLVWGNLELTAPESSILLTYNCIESDDAGTYQAVLDTIAGAAGKVGGQEIPGVAGWVFPAAGLVAGLLSTALALDGDDQLFNASHAVDADRHLELTTGAFWRVRRDGTHLNSDWDWELRMEVWGCHNYGTLVP